LVSALIIMGLLLLLGSWNFLHYGLWQSFGLTIGSWAIITGALIVLLTAIGMRRWPKIGVYINMLAIGVFIDIFNWLIPDVEGWFRSEERRVGKACRAWLSGVCEEQRDQR